MYPLVGWTQHLDYSVYYELFYIDLQFDHRFLSLPILAISFALRSLAIRPSKALQFLRVPIDLRLSSLRGPLRQQCLNQPDQASTQTTIIGDLQTARERVHATRGIASASLVQASVDFNIDDCSESNFACALHW
ncbi:hypothetical protein EDD22DRAFT_1050505 [Suillus occidentalis]|nr:hypothetical protein EDD22DRAFT_1050505 [Suillus occidentalis]